MFNIIQYRKTNNDNLFKSISDIYNIHGLQNYIPIYKSIFNLSENNYNKINLNTEYSLHDFIDAQTACIAHVESSQVIPMPVHIKFAAVLDPFRYIMGKYSAHKDIICNLPIKITPSSEVLPKVDAPMNSSYTDSLFYYLSTKLLEKYNFVHGVKCYGSFMGIQNGFKFKINDDLEYLSSCKYFVKNSNKLFKVDDYSHILSDESSSTNSSKKKDKLNIDNQFLSDEIEDVVEFSECNFDTVSPFTQNDIHEIKPDPLQSSLEIEMEIFAPDVDDIITDSSSNEEDSCDDDSSDSSSSDDESSEDGDNNCKHENGDGCDHDNEKTDDDDGDDVWEDESGSGSDESDEEDIFVTLDKFPVTFICMEKCEDTLDTLIERGYFTTDEMWYAMFMQIIMILIVYQKAFSFTHNDLHTNNIMYVYTDQTHIKYIYNSVVYRVPTYGKIFKIIDFGRSIYKVNNVEICSDCYDVSGDAHSQYNYEPYVNVNKPIVLPNPSFDLCRLGTSIFDYLINNPNKNVDVIHLVEEWCCDDNGKNILYKTNGDERYPDFKLYKMIARKVHNHKPEDQLLRSCFRAFVTKKTGKLTNSINIDVIPSFYTNNAKI
jgi:hypothetical protein